MKHLIQLLCLSLFLLGFPSIHYADEVVYYHTDNFGTPMAMTDQTGEVVWRADELPFGEEYETEELPQQNNRRFLGKELDKETGLVYMGARYLDPKTGRFTQPDPVGIVDPFNHGKINQAMLENPQRQNRYVYGLNNPYKYIDPDGNSARDIEDHINPYEAVLEGGGGRGGSGYSHGGSGGKSIFSGKRSTKGGNLGPAANPQRVHGPWTQRDLARANEGKGPLDLAPTKNRAGRDVPLELHHADQMPGSAVHEVTPFHSRIKGAHPNKYNQGVTPRMRQEDAQLHWYLRGKEMGN